MSAINVFDQRDQAAKILTEYLVEFLESIPPYKEIDFDVNQYSDFLHISNISISSFCKNCNCTSVFCGDLSSPAKSVFADPVMSIQGRRISSGRHTQPIEECYRSSEFMLCFYLTCAKCGEKHYYSLLFKNNKAIKYGQYPSYTTIDVSNLVKYKNIISKYYPELTKSVNAYSQGMGVAAFVYLRRILEHLIESKYHGDPSWKFVEKLKEVEKSEEIIPMELSEIKEEIYSILSKGIHEYDEDECKELYLSVKFVIEQLLDLELQKKIRAEQARKAKSAIKSKLCGKAE